MPYAAYTEVLQDMKRNSETIVEIPNTPIHQKACHLFSKRTQFSATSFCCTANVNFRLSATIRGVSAATGQPTVLHAHWIIKRIKQQVNLMFVAGHAETQDTKTQRPLKQNSNKKGNGGDSTAGRYNTTTDRMFISHGHLSVRYSKKRAAFPPQMDGTKQRTYVQCTSWRVRVILVPPRIS